MACAFPGRTRVASGRMEHMRRVGNDSRVVPPSVVVGVGVVVGDVPGQRAELLLGLPPRPLLGGLSAGQGATGG